MANMRVAIIGAGAAGLAMSRYLVNEPQIDFVAFEMGSDIGGVWRYTKGTGQTADEYNISPMYKNLWYKFVFVLLGSICLLFVTLGLSGHRVLHRGLTSFIFL